MRRFPALVAALAALLVPLAPARAADPTVLVATQRDGSLVRLTLTGRLAHADVLVHSSEYTWHVAMQARGNAVSYVSITDLQSSERSDVSVLDTTTGARKQVTRDGRSGFLLVSPDGSARYVLRTDDDGGLRSLVRIDARGRVRTLLAQAGRTSQLSGAGLSPNGRAVYLARTTTGPSALLAVDTTTGRATPVRPDLALGLIYNVVASPDGKTLAVSHVADDGAAHVTLVPLAGGAPRDIVLPADLTASSFTRDGSAVVLTVPFLDEALPVGSNLFPGVFLGDVTTGAVTPVLGTGDVFQAVVVS